MTVGELKDWLGNHGVPNHAEIELQVKEYLFEDFTKPDPPYGHNLHGSDLTEVEYDVDSNFVYFKGV